MTKPDIRIVPAKPEHIRTIAKRMRQADRDEVHAASGRSPGSALVYSLRKSTVAYTGLVNGRPEVMFGVGDLNILAGVGAPWLLGTDVIEKNAVAFLRLNVGFLVQLSQRYEVLRNFVDDRNAVSIRWLRWLGFKLFDPVEMRGHQFRLFELRFEDVRPLNGSDYRRDLVRGRWSNATGERGASGSELQRERRGYERENQQAAVAGRD